MLLISHLAGDFLLQTERHAVDKRGGPSRDPERWLVAAVDRTSHAICLPPVALVEAS